MLRLILGVLAGAVAGMVAITAVEAVGHRIWPLPPGIGPGDMDAFGAALAAMPIGALLAIIAAWTAGAFVGALIAKLIARRTLACWIVAGLVAASIIVNAAMIPGPLWMPAAGIVLVVLAAWLASRIKPLPA